MPKYSIIIAIYNRLDEARELLASVEELDFPKDQFELIFADDGSTDNFDVYIEDYKKNSSIDIVFMQQANQGPSAARNFAMTKARGEYFIFVDSDCMLPPEWLKTIDMHLEKDPLDAFGGPDTYHESFSPLLKAINYAMTSFIGTGGIRGNKKSVTKKFYPRTFNMGIRRKVYEEVGGMGTLRFGEDMDFSARIYEAGFKVGLIGDAFVYHKRRTSLRKFFKQIFNTGVARVNLSRLHKGMLKPVHFLPAVVLVGTVLLLCGMPFLPYKKVVFGLFFGAMGAIALFAFLQSLAMYKNIKAAFLSIITLYIQVYTYGMGMLYGFTQKGTAHGITKNYYK